MEQRSPFEKKRCPWVVGAVALGLALRLFHYLRVPAVWHDEAALILNVLGHSFAGLLGPLYFSEAAPPLFLWLEKAVVLILGDGTQALRLLPLLASGVALLGIVAVGRRLLRPAAVVALALLFASSDRLLWHACEAKPYAVDVLVATGLLALVVLGQERPLSRQLAVAAALAPLLMFLSYPACFLLGGLALSWLPAVTREKRLGTRLVFGFFLILLAGSFLLLYVGPVRSQRDSRLLQCWRDMFPNWDKPWLVPYQGAIRLAEVARYAYEPIGNSLVVVMAMGAVALWRAGQRRVVAVALWPIALASAAWVIGKYPIGATRVMVFAAPGILLLLAAGLPSAFALARRLGWIGPVVLGGFVFFPVGQAAFRVYSPWPRADSDLASAWVHARRAPGELVVGTSWDHEYYFRDRPADYREYFHERAWDLGQRRPGLWLVATYHLTQERYAILEELCHRGGWRLCERHEFLDTTVFHLARFKKGSDPLKSRGQTPF